MPEFTLEQPAATTPSADLGFIQTVRLADGKRVIATARWHLGANPAEGVVQILDLTVAPEHRRQGQGGRLLKELFRQAAEHCRSRRIKLRRVWVSVEQKSQIHARAFLTQNGFHHIGTIPEMLRDGDLLIYSRAFD